MHSPHPLSPSPSLTLLGKHTGVGEIAEDGGKGVESTVQDDLSRQDHGARAQRGGRGQWATAAPMASAAGVMVGTAGEETLEDGGGHADDGEEWGRQGRAA